MTPIERMRDQYDHMVKLNAQGGYAGFNAAEMVLASAAVVIVELLTQMAEAERASRGSE